MSNNILVNKDFDEALKKYIILKKGNLLEDCNDTKVMLIKVLIMIYGDLDIINPHITKDTKTLIDNLTKYGYAKRDVIVFLGCFTNIENYDFVLLAKQIIDMLYLKSRIINISISEKNSLLKILKDVCLEDFASVSKISNYFEQKFSEKTMDNNIEFLAVEPNFTEKEEINKKFYFQLDAVGGYVSIMTILVTIALVCAGVIIINVLVG